MARPLVLIVRLKAELDSTFERDRSYITDAINETLYDQEIHSLIADDDDRGWEYIG